MENPTKAFSIDAEFELALRAGDKKVITRFPTDQEWADRHRAVKTIIVRYGSGSQTKSTGVEEADASLLQKIRTTSDCDFDGFEANALIGKLSKADASEAVAVPGGYEIPVTVVGGIVTKHTLRVPSEREMRTYRRGAFVFIDLRHGKQELKTSPAAIGDFYDLLAVGNDGYLGAVPLCHKTAAVIELTQTVDALDGEDDPEAFT